MIEAGATHLLLSTLDDIAWLTNLRGRDILYNPLFMGYMLISTERACLYTSEKRFTEQLRHDWKKILRFSRTLGFKRIFPACGNMPRCTTILKRPA